MLHTQVPLRVGEIVTARVRRKLSETRVMIDLKGRMLVADPEQTVSVGDPITVQVLAISPRIRLRLLTPPQTAPASSFPLDLRT